MRLGAMRVSAAAICSVKRINTWKRREGVGEEFSCCLSSEVSVLSSEMVELRR